MPETFGHYRILRTIGEGGMGVVYEARDDRLERAVAVKALHETTQSREARRRFWREARSLASVSHPHICQVFDVVEEGDTLFLGMELLQGQNLAARLENGPVTVNEAVQVARQILEALDASAPHRNRPPGSQAIKCFLTRHGVKLLDFGLARHHAATVAADGSTQTGATFTSPGMVAGTPAYMSPEQVNGLTAGPAADIFAAGCVLYEMLSGKRAFSGSSVVDLFYAVVHNHPPLVGGSKEIEALDRVIRRAMGKRVEDRYGSSREMLQAVDGIGAAASGSPAARARIVTLVIALPLRVLRHDPETDFLAFSLPDAISRSLSGADGLIVRSSLLAAQFEGPFDPRRVAAEADVDAIVTGSLLRAGDNIRLTCQLVEAPAAV